MIKRIKGWTAPDVDIHPGGLAASFVLRANKNPDDVPCVAVIGDERVFTESDVKEAIERRIDALPDTLSVADYQRIRDVLDFLDPA